MGAGGEGAAGPSLLQCCANFESYKSQIWFRVEQVAHLSAHSFATMYVMTGDHLSHGIVHTFDTLTNEIATLTPSLGLASIQLV